MLADAGIAAFLAAETRDPEQLALCHGMGTKAIHRLRTEFPDAAAEAHVGFGIALP